MPSNSKEEKRAALSYHPRKCPTSLQTVLKISNQWISCSQKKKKRKEGQKLQLRQEARENIIAMLDKSIFLYIHIQNAQSFLLLRRHSLSTNRKCRTPNEINNKKITAADLITEGRAVVSSWKRDVSNSFVKSLGFSSPSCRHTRSCSESAAVSGSTV